MFPTSFGRYHVNTSIGNTESFCQYSSVSSAIGFSNFTNLLFSELAFWMKFSFKTLGASFNRCIFHVIGMCTKPEMFRVPTSRIIAFMAHFHFLWYGSKMEQPRKTMNLPELGLISDLPVTIRIDRSGPNKAACNNSSFLIESVKNCRFRKWLSPFSFSVDELHFNSFRYTHTEVN